MSSLLINIITILLVIVQSSIIKRNLKAIYYIILALVCYYLGYYKDIIIPLPSNY